MRSCRWVCSRDTFTDTDYAAADRFVEDKDHSPEDAPAPQQSPVIHEQSPAPCVAELAPATPESSQQSTANPQTYPVVGEQASDANTSVVIDERSILPGVAAPATPESTQRSTANPEPYPVVGEQASDANTSVVIDERSILPGAAAPATLESTQRSTAISGPYPVVAEQSLDTSTSSTGGKRIVLSESPGCDSREYRIIRTNSDGRCFFR